MSDKDVNFNIRLDPLLRDAFKAACASADVSGGAILRQAMKDFVAAHAQGKFSLSIKKGKSNEN